MTKEEMADKHAEEYVMREDVITENDRVPFDNGYGFQTVSFEDEVKKGFKDGFLAGLKASRPQWHYVKNGDLPKEIKEYLVYKIDGYGCKSIQVMQFNNQHCWCADCQNSIKAWKEIVLPELKESD